jgi:hypothetical protein
MSKNCYWKIFILLLLFTIIVYVYLIYNPNVEGFIGNINNNKSILNFYVFYSEKCPHSNIFLNTNWNILRQKYANKIIFNKIDCDDVNTKGICINFGVKSVPTIYIVKEKDDTEKDDKIIFQGERSLENLEKFLNHHIELNKKEFFENTSTSQQIKPTIDDIIEFEQLEDIKKKEYSYCIKYKDEDKKIFNHCQNINEKETPNIKSWQGSYTVIGDYLKTVTKNLEEKKQVAFKNKDNISDWHLCDPILLQTIKTNTELMTDNKEDLDVNKSIEYACGFNK